MHTSNPSIHFASLDQELFHLLVVLHDLEEFLQRSRLAVIPDSIYEDIARLEEGIAQARKKAGLLEGERQNLRSMLQVGTFVNSSLELDQVLSIVMDTLIHFTGAERAFLMLQDAHGEMAVRMVRNWEQESLAPDEYAFSRTVVNRVIEGGKPVITTNAMEDPRFSSQESVSIHNLRSILCVPIKGKEALIGVIYAEHRSRSGLFTHRDLDLLVEFAAQAGVALENARLFASVKQSLAEVIALKNLMDNVMGSVASGVMAVDLAGRLTLCNPAVEGLLRRPAGELVGKTLAEIDLGLAAALQPSLDVVLQTGQALIGQERSQHFQSLGSLDLHFSLSPLKDGGRITQGVTIIIEDLTEINRLESQRRLFERMVDPAVIQDLDPNSLQLGGRRGEITVLFADLRDFTGFAESMPPEDLVRVLNCYLAAAAEAVLHEGGTVDKFLGDAVMAWFNAPLPQEDHTLRAVRAAVRIRNAVKALHRTLPPEYRLDFGIGIHTGEAILGLVGSEQRLDYTAIGDSVNTARRIQENAGRGKILVSQEAYRSVAAHVAAVEVEPIQAKGKRELIPAYEILELC